MFFRSQKSFYIQDYCLQAPDFLSICGFVTIWN